MTALVWPLFTQDFLPRNLAVAAVDRESEKFVAMSDWHAVVNARGVVMDRLLRRANRCCGQDVNGISENDG